MRTPDPPTLAMTREDLLAWEARVGALLADAGCDLEILHALVHSFLFARDALTKARGAVARLKRLFLGPRSEKSGVILSKPSDPGQENGEQEASSGTGKKRKRKRKGEEEEEEGGSSAEGHGRNGADQYVGARRILVPHPDFKAGDDNDCPNEGCDGKVYPMKEPKKILRIIGQPAVMAYLWLLERWRCNLCEVIFYAPRPAEAEGEDKYNETAVAMIAILHFANGFAFHRLEQHQALLGIPLPASTQSELLSEASQKLRPFFDALVWHAAQCDVLHNDDTGMKVLALLAAIKESSQQEASAGGKKPRTGIHTTGIVGVTAAYEVSLYFTGRKHAGENLADVLEKREKGLPPPTHVSDGLGHNRPGKMQVDESKCLTHGRRQFVDIVNDFPEKCEHVISFIREVYRIDAIAKQRKLSDEDRLLLHQEKSGPVMDKLRRWLEDQLLFKGVEPNSPLGKAIVYMLKRWEQLTLFLQKPGTPLDNNIVERALKKAIRYRKNSSFYKTENGAAVGDLYMSIIETCNMNKANPFHYVTTLLKNIDRAQKSPRDWMPWNYRTTLSQEAIPNEIHAESEDTAAAAAARVPALGASRGRRSARKRPCHVTAQERAAAARPPDPMRTSPMARGFSLAHRRARVGAPPR